MGRGRQKAKQTKVARQLKYYSPDTDLHSLERELHGEPVRLPVPAPSDSDESEDVDEDIDPYATRYGGDEDDWAVNGHR